MAPRPLWVFDSPLLRRALAEMNLAAVPVIVRAACGLAQKDFAAVAGWSKDALGAYERGARGGVFDLRMLLPFADAIGMPRQALLPLVLADPDVGPADDDDIGNGTVMEMDRHRFGTLIAGAAAAALAPRVPGGTTVSGAHLRYWQAGTDALYARDRAAGGSALLRPALRHWQQVRQALVASPGSRELRAVAGEAALCAGWIALDGGGSARARLLYGQARDLAAEAGDPFLTAHVLASMSMLEAEHARTGPGRDPASRALQLAYTAAEEARGLPVPRLHALIALRGASAASLLGDKAAFQAGTGRARRELARGYGDADPPQWLRFVTPAEVTGVEARGWLNLGDYGHAASLYRAVLEDDGLQPRNRASYGAGLADALLRNGDLKEAVAAAETVLTAIENGVNSARPEPAPPDPHRGCRRPTGQRLLHPVRRGSRRILPPGRAVPCRKPARIRKHPDGFNPFLTSTGCERVLYPEPSRPIEAGDSIVTFGRAITADMVGINVCVGWRRGRRSYGIGGRCAVTRGLRQAAIPTTCGLRSRKAGISPRRLPR